MISVIGEILIDRYIFGETTRLSPEAPVAIVKHNKTEDRPGGAYNVYHNIKSLTNNVNFSVECQDPPIKMRVYSGSHYVTRIDFNDGGNSWNIIDNYTDSNIVVVSDYDKGLFNKLSDIPNLPEKTIVDAKKDLSKYHGVWCLKPNKLEFERYTGKWQCDSELYELMTNTIIDLSLTHLIVTLGPDGVAYSNNSGYFFHEHTKAIDVNDVTGAGDTFIATLAFALDNDYHMIDAIKLANKAAGIAVSHIGTYIIKQSDIL